MYYPEALAWKPTTHVFLGEEALRDALDGDGRITISYVDYQKGKVKGVIGNYPVSPKILEALSNHKAQYRAGILGPDAYPDIMTGQQVIHPDAPDSNAWLEYLWRIKDEPENNSSAVRAFVTGYLTHAAGDMFGHTFVNNFTDAPFTINPPENAIKHIIVEGMVDKRTPAPTFDASINGVDNFIYRTLVYASPNSELDKNLLKEDGEGTTFSIPRIFSTLRNKLDKDINDFDNNKKNTSEDLERKLAKLTEIETAGECLLLGGISEKCRDLQADIVKLTAEKTDLLARQPIRDYKKAWRDDIDRGLQEWANVSHKVAVALFFNSTRKADVESAKNILEDYAVNHLLKMVGAPDVASEILKKIEALGETVENIINAIIPINILDPIRELKKDFVNTLVKQAIGMTLDELKEYLSNPEQNFDKFITKGDGENINCVNFNKKYLKIEESKCIDNIDNPQTYKVADFTAAYNTVLMSKLIMLDSEGITQLLRDLGSNEQVKTLPNAMLGFIRSLDGDNQWSMKSRPPINRQEMIFARDCRIYTKLFMKQAGERPITRQISEQEKAQEEKNIERIYKAVYQRTPTQEEIANAIAQLSECVAFEGIFPTPIIFVDIASTKLLKLGTRDFPFTSLRDAVNAASNGDTLLITGGKYSENIVINKDIDLVTFENQSVVVGN